MPNLLIDEMMVPALDPGIELFVRNKRPAGLTAFRPQRTVLFVHGATYPAHTTFDLQLNGLSWMDYIAAHGYDVYLLDIRGYGRSTRPREMADKPEAHPPIVRGETALKDIAAVIDFIRKRRGVSRLALAGWSWGTALMATYATRNPDKVERVVLHAPLWIRHTPSSLQPGSGPLGAYRTVTREQARTRWYDGVAEDNKAGLIADGGFDAWADATWASDPEGAKLAPAVIRAPNGVVQDGVEYWSAGRAYYDPAKITAPTLLIVGAWDHDTPPYMARTLFPLLINSPGKRLVELDEGTHHVMMEKNRRDLFDSVQSFLDASRAP
jgi:pimeloyl-ACP methyl ester carboxylesterase